MRDFAQDHRWLSINTATIRKSRGANLPLPDIIEACVRRDGVEDLRQRQVGAAALADGRRVDRKPAVVAREVAQGGCHAGLEEPAPDPDPGASMAAMDCGSSPQ